MKLLRNITLGVILLSVFVSLPTNASTTFPGKNGKIIFTQPLNDTTALLSIRPEGNKPKVWLKGDIESPKWSPDGKKIVLTRSEGGKSSIELLNHTGKSQNLTTGEYNDTSPAWSPNGNQIAFIRKEKGGQERQALMIITLKNMSERNCTGWLSPRDTLKALSWSPNNSKIVYEQANDGGNFLQITHVKTGKTVRVTEVSDDRQHAILAWSPRGDKILFNDSENEIYTIWPDGSHRTVISDGDSYDASWSPDGKRIAFLEDRTGSEISISQEDGTIHWVSVEKGHYDKIGAPVWSPDGSRLIFALSGKDGLDSALFSLKLSRETPDMAKIYDGMTWDLNWQAK